MLALIYNFISVIDQNKDFICVFPKEADERKLSPLLSEHFGVDENLCKNNIMWAHVAFTVNTFFKALQSLRFSTKEHCLSDSHTRLFISPHNSAGEEEPK